MPTPEEKLADMTESQYFDFEIVLDGIDDLENPAADAFYDAGCDDATLAIIGGVPRLLFTRESESLQQAVSSAVLDICKVARSFPNVRIVRVEFPIDELLADIQKLSKMRFAKSKDSTTHSLS